MLSEREKAGLIKAYYDTAIRCYQAGDFDKAVSYWEQIMQLDPTQLQPPKLIAVAKDKIREKYSKALKNVEALYAVGKYTQALAEMNTALLAAPNSEALMTFNDQLGKVHKALGDETSQTRIGQYIRAAVNEYLKPTPKLRSAIHGIIYAGQLQPGNGRIKKFIEVLTEAYPSQVKAVEIVPGMTLVEQKLVASLNYIYDAKYDRAILECNDILELEPNNVMALKRQGSAYYALKKTERAKQIWREALKLNPKDAELQSFLKQ
ncbi:MAG: hypothetical protein A2297_05810 [Elusimicrobia bacterium RIFOXYB2_FULL_48_7]|nr:MAG: hypothetical protein A2297_05810 [Elusimicrobia bacterium RIFOXYB2_FULL_48_7]